MIKMGRSKLFQVRCDECDRIIQPQENRVELLEDIYDEEYHGMKRKIVAHYCWGCYKELFHDVVVKR